MVKVTVVVPNWNRRDLLERLLPRLAAQTVSPLEILVVDNGSDDDSVSVARQFGARVLEMGSNAGFSRAVNRGIGESSGEWVAIVNNDVEMGPEWLAHLLAAADEPGVWFATGKIYRAGSPKRLDGSFDALARSGCAWRCGENRPDGPAWSRPSPIQFAPFTAAVFRRRLFTDLGDLDEAFESYLEDVDFGLRCALAGYQGRYVPGAVAWHQGSATLGKWHPETVRRLSRNQVFLVAKHYPAGTLLRFAWPVLMGQLLWGCVAFRHGAGWSWLKGKLEGLRAVRRLRRAGRRPAGVEAVLRASESEIERLQRRTGFDWYWRLYFALT